MTNNDVLTLVKNDYYELVANKLKNRAYIKVKGYWDRSNEVSEFIDDVKACIGMLEGGFTLLIDLIHYNGTSSGLHHLHVEAQRISVLAGVSRIAEVFNRNPVLKSFSQEYSIKTGAITMGFNDLTHAEKWLDLY